MAKIYSKTTESKSTELKPKQETINFLLNFSKSLEVKSSGNYLVEIHKN